MKKYIIILFLLLQTVLVPQASAQVNNDESAKFLAIFKDIVKNGNFYLPSETYYEYTGKNKILYTMFDDFDYNGKKELLIVSYGDDDNYGFILRMYKADGTVSEITIDQSIGPGLRGVEDISFAKGNTGIYIFSEYFGGFSDNYNYTSYSHLFFYKYKDGKLIEESKSSANMVNYYFDELQEASNWDSDINSFLNDLPPKILHNYEDYLSGVPITEDASTYIEAEVNGQPYSQEQYEAHIKPYLHLIEKAQPFITGLESSGMKVAANNNNVDETFRQIEAYSASDVELPTLGEDIKDSIDANEASTLIQWAAYSEALSANGLQPTDDMTEEILSKLLTSPYGLKHALTVQEDAEGFYYNAGEADAVLKKYVGRTFSNSFTSNSFGITKKNDKYYFTREKKSSVNTPVYRVNSIYQISPSYYLVDFWLYNLQSYSLANALSTDELTRLSNEPIHTAYTQLSTEQQKLLPKIDAQYVILKKTADANVPWQLVERNSAELFTSTDYYIEADAKAEALKEADLLKVQAQELEQASAKSNNTATTNSSAPMMITLLAGIAIGVIIMLLMRKRQTKNS